MSRATPTGSESTSGSTGTMPSSEDGPDASVALTGGRFADPVRRGDVVQRRCGPGAENVHALLRHLRDRGVRTVPEPRGFSPDGKHEFLSFIPGLSGFPPMSVDQRSEAALISAVRAVREVHDASQGFVAPSDIWHHQEIARPVAPDCIGHLDLAPWNFIFDGTAVAAIIDWDTAAPTSRVWDLCYLAYQFAPMHDDSVLTSYGWNEVPDRRRRLEIIADTYGGVTVAELLDVMPIRLAATAAMMERQIVQGDPTYETHATEGHAEGWRSAAAHVITTRQSVVSLDDD